MDVMMDLETLGTSSDSVILSIGAIKFKRSGKYKEGGDPYSVIDKKNIFYKHITLKSNLDIGLKINDDTTRWWMKQDKKVRDSVLFSIDRMDLKEALKEFNNFFKGCRYIWGNGSSFDVSIIENAYNRCNMEIPWKFWNVRDLRTLLDICGVRSPKGIAGEFHNPVYDCYNQIVGVHRCDL